MHEHQAIKLLFEQNPASVLATVVSVKGSAYRRAGARMLLTADGRSAGVINGGCLDNDLHARAAAVLETGRPQLACYDTTSPQDIVFGLGMGCQGVVKILLEPVASLHWLQEGCTVAAVFEGELGTRVYDEPVTEHTQVLDTVWGRALVERIEPTQCLYLFGAGADAVPLHGMAQILGWETRVVDLRPPSPTRAPLLSSTFIEAEQLSAALEIPPGAACVIMTHNFLHDLELLKVLLPSAASYIGILGPQRRTAELLSKIGRDTLAPGIVPTPQQLDRLYAPIGLDLGADTPEEIALSIVAEIQRVRRARSAVSLRERERIH